MGDQKITLKIMVDDKVVATINDALDFDAADFEWFKEELGLSCEHLLYMLTEAKEISKSPWLGNDRHWFCHVGNNWFVYFYPDRQGEVITRYKDQILPKRVSRSKPKMWKDPRQLDLPFPDYIYNK